MSGYRGRPEPVQYLERDGKTQRRKNGQPGWRLRYTSPGRKPRERKFFGTYREALLALEELIREEDALGAALVPDAGVALAAYLQSWADAYSERPVSQSAKNEHSGNLERHLLPALKRLKWGKRPLRQFTRHDIEKLLENSRRMNGEPLSENGRKSCLKTLNMVFKQAVLDGVILRSPTDGLTSSWRTRTRNEDEDYTPSIDEVEQVILGIPEDRDYCSDMLRFLAWSGLRISEARGLKTSRVWVDHRRIEVRERLTTSGGIQTDERGLKTSFSRREVPILNGAALPVVRMMGRAEKLGSEYLFVGAGKRSSRKQAGPGPIGYTDLAAVLRNAIADTGSQHFTLHSLRSTFATTLISAGVSVELVSRWLGHSSVGVTRGVYARNLFGENMTSFVDEVQESLDAAAVEPSKGLSTYAKVRKNLGQPL